MYALRFVGHCWMELGIVVLLVCFVSWIFLGGAIKMKSSCLALACLALLSGFEVLAGSVLELGDSDFESKVAALDNTLVMFYAPW